MYIILNKRYILHGLENYLLISSNLSAFYLNFSSSLSKSPNDFPFNFLLISSNYAAFFFRFSNSFNNSSDNINKIYLDSLHLAFFINHQIVLISFSIPPILSISLLETCLQKVYFKLIVTTLNPSSN